MDKKEEHEEAEITHTQASQPNRDCASAGARPRLRAQAAENGGGVSSGWTLRKTQIFYSNTISFSNPCFRALIRVAGYESGAGMGAKRLEVAHKPRVTYQSRQV